jgi:hypothetical protein
MNSIILGFFFIDSLLILGKFVKNSESSLKNSLVNSISFENAGTYIKACMGFISSMIWLTKFFIEIVILLVWIFPSSAAPENLHASNY